MCVAVCVKLQQSADAEGLCCRYEKEVVNSGQPLRRCAQTEAE